MLYSTRSKMVASFLGVSLLVGAASLFIGVRLFDEHVFGEALNRVRQDLNAANEMYVTRVNQFKTSLSITTLGLAFISSVRDKNTTDLALRLERMAKLADLDFAGVVAEDGSVLCRIGPNTFPGPGRPLRTLWQSGSWNRGLPFPERRSCRANFWSRRTTSWPNERGSSWRPDRKRHRCKGRD